MTGARRGAVYVVYGHAAWNEALQSVITLKRQMHGLDVTVVGDRAVMMARHVPLERRDPGGRWAKLHADRLSPYAETLYIDADTRVRGDLTVGFDILADGWDIVLTASERQGAEAFWHASEAERAATWEELGEVLQLQAGVLFFRRSPAVAALFAAWRDEWGRWRGPDQAALVRALARVPVRVWLLGRPFNGGAVVEHRFGCARDGEALRWSTG